jgi:hypothetical protein
MNMKLRRNAIFWALGEASHQLAKMGGAYLNGPLAYSMSFLMCSAARSIGDDCCR